MVWDLQKHKATFKASGLEGEFNGEEPHNGLELRGSDGKSKALVFSFLLNEPPEEAYIRNEDLFVRYPARNSDLVSYSTYYRVADGGESVEFILSAQTALLDSAPLTKVSSTFASATILCRTSTGKLQTLESEMTFDDDPPMFFLIRPKDDEAHSWVLLIHPTDFHRGSAMAQQISTISLHVFPDALEKGVIRRATMKCSRVKRENDVAAAEALYDRLAAAAPPLAT